MNLSKDPALALSMLEVFAQLAQCSSEMSTVPHMARVIDIYQGKRTLELQLCYGFPRSDVAKTQEQLTEEQKGGIVMQTEAMGIYLPPGQLETLIRNIDLGPSAIITRKAPNVHITTEYRVDGFPECFYIECIDEETNTAVLPPLCLAYLKGQDSEAKTYLHNAAELLRGKGIKVSTKENPSHQN